MSGCGLLLRVVPQAVKQVMIDTRAVTHNTITVTPDGQHLGSPAQPLASGGTSKEIGAKTRGSGCQAAFFSFR